MTLTVWRVGKGSFEPHGLRLVLENVETGHTLLRGIPPGSIIRTTARLARFHKGVEGLVSGAIEVIEPDTEFQLALEGQKSPRTFRDPVLGTLAANPPSGWEGEVRWLGRKCGIFLNRLDDLAVAHALWRAQRRWTRDAVRVATERLVTLKNGEWLGERERPVSPDRFGKKLSLVDIAIEDGGDFVFDFDDGDLFFGHTIVVRGNLSEGFTHANIAG
ncbi:DUF2262 domain-containing protein [Brevundimonas poindexterae]|uniref:DUF2262 domain-containing protein n=1 Tax=Brevundimonas poindexterae TaxID=74325 RepID=UPI001CFD5B1D|nr:DUF2262 domain-containing protein [Brevundimonas poindexterae]